MREIIVAMKQAQGREEKWRAIRANAEITQTENNDEKRVKVVYIRNARTVA